jgi:hypothetical protein
MTTQEHPASPAFPARDLALFGLALSVRLACWLWFVRSGVRPVFDESGYFRIAGAWAEVLRRLAELSLPTEALIRSAWGDGMWPPLHPFLLGLARVLPGDDLPAARLVGVAAGALTTLLVARLTARLAGRPAALAAGLAHALFPSFVFFSVSLWSETLFMLLLLALLARVVRALDGDPGAAAGGALWLGAGSALLLLTRAAALPMVAGLLVWLIVRGRRGPWTRMVVGAAVVTLLLVLPWSLASTRFAGRPIVLSTSDTLNLALGNNPWTPPALGSAWGVAQFKQQVLDAARGEGGVDRAGEIARHEILGHPLRTAQRVVVRAAQLLGLDFYPLRHLAMARLPPLPAWTLPAGFILQWLSLAVLIFATAVGLFGVETIRHRSLLLTLVVAGSAGPLATVAVPRLTLPLLVLLLPAAGCGWTKLRRRASGLPNAAGWILAAGCLLLPIATLRQVIQHHLASSSHYSAVLTRFAGMIGASPLYADLLACQPPEGALTLPSIATPAPQTARWLDTAALPVRLREPTASVRHLALAGSDLEGPLAFRIGAGAPVRVSDPERWQHFLPVPGTTLVCSWQGGVLPLE